ncbi:MAG: phosphate signaling complex protein PhoU [Thermoplasmata archaeon]|nr:phosphate signaling complex protein PhoU [Thermoplasmata archaeon]
MNETPPPKPEEPRGADTEIRRLKERAREMGQWALRMVHDGWEAFRTGNLEAAQKVLDGDTELDRYDEQIEHEIISFLVLKQPAAVDLRTAAALLKITTHLDRIGRLGFDMARITTPETRPDVPELVGVLKAMDQTVESMVQQSLDALVEDQAPLAMGLFVRDDEVDRMHRQATRLVVRELVRDPMSALHLANELLVARHLERIADNACKIGEKTIYAVTGQRRSEYLPRHPYTPYILETPRPK